MEINLDEIQQYGDEISIELHGESKYTEGLVIVEKYSSFKRAYRCLFAVMLCVFFIIISALIPILHFILLPLSVLISPFIIFSVAKSKNSIRGGKGICPFCNASFDIFQRNNKFPFSDVCTECKRLVNIKKIEI